MGGCCCLSLARDPRPCPGLSRSGAWAQAAPRRSDRTYREAENTASKCVSVSLPPTSRPGLLCHAISKMQLFLRSRSDPWLEGQDFEERPRCSEGAVSPGVMPWEHWIPPEPCQCGGEPMAPPPSTQIREACLGERDRESGRWLPPRQAASSLLNWFPGTLVQWTGQTLPAAPHDSGATVPTQCLSARCVRCVRTWVLIAMGLQGTSPASRIGL